MNAPEVTVLMSVHNETRFLAAAVRSVLEQSWGGFEFLIIDDGSTEPVAEIVSGFRDDRIRFIQQDNIGLTRSLNRGIDMACGKYIARMDSDDISARTRLEKQLNQVAQCPQLEIVGSFFDIIDENDGFIKSKILITDPVYRLWRLQFHNNYAHGSMLMLKSAVQRVGKYDETVRYAQDYDLWGRISRKDNSFIIPEALYKYRFVKNSSQVSTRNYDDQLNAAIFISNKSLKLSNPGFTDHELIHVRSVYWNFQLATVSKKGLLLIPQLFTGFCSRYGLDAPQRDALWTIIQQDIEERMKSNSYTNE